MKGEGDMGKGTNLSTCPSKSTAPQVGLFAVSFWVSNMIGVVHFLHFVDCTGYTKNHVDQSCVDMNLACVFCEINEIKEFLI